MAAKKSTKKGVSAKSKLPRKAAAAALPPGMTAASGSSVAAPWAALAGPPQPQVASFAAAAAAQEELLLVCLQDPFDGIGASWSKIKDSLVPASDHDSSHQWRLRSVLEINPPRFFESWATTGGFTLDLSVKASVAESAGQWGGHVETFTSPSSCRVMIMRDTDNKVRMSLASGANQATEKRMPRPDTNRFLNADIGFEANGASGLTAGAVAVVSNKNWSRLIAGSVAATKGLAFDGKWRTNLEDGDGDSPAQGTWAFAVMTRTDYSALCRNKGWTEHIEG